MDPKIRVRFPATSVCCGGAAATRRSDTGCRQMYKVISLQQQVSSCELRVARPPPKVAPMGLRSLSLPYRSDRLLGPMAWGPGTCRGLVVVVVVLVVVAVVDVVQGYAVYC